MSLPDIQIQTKLSIWKNGIHNGWVYPIFKYKQSCQFGRMNVGILISIGGQIDCNGQKLGSEPWREEFEKDSKHSIARTLIMALKKYTNCFSLCKSFRVLGTMWGAKMLTKFMTSKVAFKCCRRLGLDFFSKAHSISDTTPILHRTLL